MSVQTTVVLAKPPFLCSPPPSASITTSTASSKTINNNNIFSLRTTTPPPPPTPLNFRLQPKQLYSLPPSPFQPSFSDEDDDVPVIGDCLVFEEDAFDDPHLLHPHIIPDPLPPAPVDSPSRRTSAVGTLSNLVPDGWRQVQAELNITKKQRRKIAQELEFNTRVEKRKRGLMPLRSLNLEEYQAYRDAKMAQLKPLLLDNPSTFKEPQVPSQDEMNGSIPSSERVKPKNPRWAVYGKGLDDVTDFFNSDNYDPADNKSPGPRKLFSKEEKIFLNKRIPDHASATSAKWKPLHTLAASGEFYLVDALLKHNVDINASDPDGLTALHKAIMCKKQAITSYLLRESANPFVQDSDSGSLMHYAVRTASAPAIKLLLLYNVDINIQDKDGWTPLHLAVQGRRTDIVKLLLIRGADKTLRNKDGLTPLDLCLYSGRATRTYELIKILKQLPKNSSGAVRKNPYNLPVS